MSTNEPGPPSAFRAKNLQLWEETLHDIFPSGIPSSMVWTGINDILRVLDKLGRPELNHTFLPSGGGLDLGSVDLSSESGCIELQWHDSYVSIVKVDVLSFESFGEDYEWAYFRLDSRHLNPSGVYGSNSDIREELTELRPGQYVERYVWDQGFYGYDESGDELPLPDEARTVSRYFSGSFVIFAKGSIYNRISGTYDARHNKMNREQFRSHIQKAIEGTPRG